MIGGVQELAAAVFLALQSKIAGAWPLFAVSLVAVIINASIN